MTKIVSIFIGLMLVMGVTHGNIFDVLPPLPIPIGPYVITTTEDLQTINIGFDNVGLMAVPFNTLCRIPLVYDYVTCFVCNQDCIYGHNKFGGRCDEDPRNPGHIICLCAETQADAISRNITESSGEMCQWVTPSALEIGLVGKLLDTTFKQIVQVRAATLLCPRYPDGSFQSSGCLTDCTVNHATSNATCKFDAPEITDLGTSPTLYCECN